jgi:hypothetical protein
MLHARALWVVHLGGAAPNPPGYFRNGDDSCRQLAPSAGPSLNNNELALSSWHGTGGDADNRER